MGSMERQYRDGQYRQQAGIAKNHPENRHSILQMLINRAAHTKGTAGRLISDIYKVPIAKSDANSFMRRAEPLHRRVSRPDVNASGTKYAESKRKWIGRGAE